MRSGHGILLSRLLRDARILIVFSSVIRRQVSLHILELMCLGGAFVLFVVDPPRGHYSAHSVYADEVHRAVQPLCWNHSRVGQRRAGLADRE